MEADIQQLFASDFYQILDFKCRCFDCKTSKPEYADNFSISFVRKGNFIFNVFRNAFDSYTGSVLFTKPGFEHTVTHAHHTPDECTIIEFKNDFYTELLGHYGKQKFFSDRDVHSLVIRTNPETEFLHFKILRLILSKQGSKLEIDGLIMEVIENTLATISNQVESPTISDRLKKNHLSTVELAKEFMIEHFYTDISLTEIARHCCVSPFHFSRTFRSITSFSPHQYLLNLRLKNADFLLSTTNMPVADIGFASGFNSAEHFSASFTRKYNTPPTTFRLQNVKHFG